MFLVGCWLVVAVLHQYVFPWTIVLTPRERHMPFHLGQCPFALMRWHTCQRGVCDMGHVLRNSVSQLTWEHTQWVGWQLFRCLQNLHSRGVVHVSLTLEVLLVNCNCDLKLTGLHHAVLL